MDKYTTLIEELVGDKKEYEIKIKEKKCLIDFLKRQINSTKTEIKNMETELSGIKEDIQIYTLKNLIDSRKVSFKELTHMIDDKAKTNGNIKYPELHANKEHIKDLYLNKDYSIKDLATLFNVSTAVMNSFLVRNKIAKQAHSIPKETKKKIINEFLKGDMTKVQIAHKYDVSTSTVYKFTCDKNFAKPKSIEKVPKQIDRLGSHAEAFF